MNEKIRFERLLILYIPWAISLLLAGDSITSYYAAWLGSFFIFYVTLSGKIKPLETDLSFSQQIMRPIIIVQIIFAGYMCCTSIFYLYNYLGYSNFEKSTVIYIPDVFKLQLIAQCQRYYVLGHAAFVTGIYAFMKYPEHKKFRVETGSVANLLFYTAIATLPISILFLKIPGLSQFANQFSSLSFIACTIALAVAIPLKKVINTAICLMLYAINFYAALTSGFKEPIILSILVLGIFLYPTYKKMVIITFLPALLALFFLLPTYAATFRHNAWAGDVSAKDATSLALDAALNNGDEKEEINWNFLVFRLSEIDMFTYFVQSTPEKIDFYGFDLLKQSLIVVVPRILWQSKPNTEDLVMERVYNAGVINRGSNVSAKPAFIVDAYLSGGTTGVFFGIIYIWCVGASNISKSRRIVWRIHVRYGTYIFGAFSNILARFKF